MYKCTYTFSEFGSKIFSLKIKYFKKGSSNFLRQQYYSSYYKYYVVEYIVHMLLRLLFNGRRMHRFLFVCLRQCLIVVILGLCNICMSFFPSSFCSTPSIQLLIYQPRGTSKNRAKE